jgi:hypothetical protein
MNPNVAQGCVTMPWTSSRKWKVFGKDGCIPGRRKEDCRGASASQPAKPQGFPFGPPMFRRPLPLKRTAMRKRDPPSVPTSPLELMSKFGESGCCGLEHILLVPIVECAWILAFQKRVLLNMLP